MPSQGGNGQKKLERGREGAKKAAGKAKEAGTKEPQSQATPGSQSEIAKKSVCNPSCYDLMLITSRDRMILLLGCWRMVDDSRKLDVDLFAGLVFIA